MTFMFSLVNAVSVSSVVVPVIISTGLIFGGTTQLIGGLIQIRAGDAVNGLLFATFGAFWIVLPAYLEWFSKAVPAAQVGHATGPLLSDQPSGDACCYFVPGGSGDLPAHLRRAVLPLGELGK
jgi:succinate-acetate transporter protein